MTDVVISEPEIEAYDFLSGAIPDNRKESFTYEYDGERVKGYVEQQDFLLECFLADVNLVTVDWRRDN